jgi:purine catabolism regulator
VGEVLAALDTWHPQLLAGLRGLGRRVAWIGTMRARLPAFGGFTGGELALLSLATLRLLCASNGTLSLAGLVDELASLGAAAIVITDPESRAGPADIAALAEAKSRADQHGIPLLELPAGTPLPMVERAVIRYLMDQREARAASRQPPAEVEHLQASLRGEALEALLTGTYAGEAQMRARAAQLGYDLTQPHVILWLVLDSTSADRSAAPPNRRGANSRGANSRGASEPGAVADALDLALGAWTLTREREVVALLLLPGERGQAELVERVKELLGRALGSDPAMWSAGLSEPATTPAEVRRSAEEARAAAQLGREVLGPGQIAQPADLGVYRLLLALRRGGELAPFVERALAPLLADKRTGEALVETLGVFFTCNGNLSEAARQLHLHRNSLLYRLHRARELLGHDLDDPELRLALQLAIKGQRVLRLG